MAKFANFPLVTIDLYGRERHPEFTNSETSDIETYSARRDRAELMMKTFSYVTNGVPPVTRLILIEEDFLDLTARTGSTATPVTASLGAGPQFGMLIDLNGKVIHYTNWQRPEQQDEVLSKIFGVPVGF